MICATRSGSHVGLHGLPADAQLEVRVVRGEGRQELRGDRLGELADVGRLGAQLQRAGLQPRQVQQPRRQLAEPVDLLAQLVP